MCHSYSACDGGDEEVAAAGVRDDDLGVDPEGRHHVFTVVVEVGEVGEVAGVVDGDGSPSAASAVRSCSGVVALWLSGGDGEGLRAVELVGGEAVEYVGEALAIRRARGRGRWGRRRG